MSLLSAKGKCSSWTKRQGMLLLLLLLIVTNISTCWLKLSLSLTLWHFIFLTTRITHTLNSYQCLGKSLCTWTRLTVLAGFLRSRLTSKSLVKFSTRSYERAGWLGSRDLGFSDRDLGKRNGKFCHVNTSAPSPGWKRNESFATVHALHRSAASDKVILPCLLYIPHHKHPI